MKSEKMLYRIFIMGDQEVTRANLLNFLSHCDYIEKPHLEPLENPQMQRYKGKLKLTPDYKDIEFITTPDLPNPDNRKDIISFAHCFILGGNNSRNLILMAYRDLDLSNKKSMENKWKLLEAVLSKISYAQLIIVLIDSGLLSNIPASIKKLEKEFIPHLIETSKLEVNPRVLLYKDGDEESTSKKKNFDSVYHFFTEYENTLARLKDKQVLIQASYAAIKPEQGEDKFSKIHVKLLDECICPITNEIMTNPVIAGDGHTYECDAIKMWLKTHDTSPTTGLKMDKNVCIPNLKVKRMITIIKEWDIDS